MKLRLFFPLFMFLYGNMYIPLAFSTSLLLNDLGMTSNKRKRDLVDEKDNPVDASSHPERKTSLISLPTDILIILAKYLRVKDGVNLSSACKRLRFLSTNELLWQNYVMRIPGYANYVRYFLYQDPQGKIREKPDGEILSSKVLFQKLMIPRIKSLFKEIDHSSFPNDSEIRLKKLSCDGSTIHGYHLSKDYFHFFAYKDKELQFSMKPIKELQIEVEEGCKELPIVTRDGSIIHAGESDASNLGAGLKVFQSSQKDNLELFPLEEDVSEPTINDSNNDGSIIVGEFNEKPVIWRNATLEYLPLLAPLKRLANNSDYGSATYTNADGTVIVGVWKGMSLLWRNNQPRFFDIEKYYDFIPNAISDNGSKIGMVNRINGSHSLILNLNQEAIKVDPLKQCNGNIICALSHDGCIGVGYSGPNGHAFIGREDLHSHNSEIFIWYELLGTIGFKDLFSFLLHEKFDFHNFRDMSLDGTTFIGPFYSLQRGEIDRFWRAYVPDYNAFKKEGILLSLFKKNSSRLQAQKT